jgi:hypothetical protein
LSPRTLLVTLAAFGVGAVAGSHWIANPRNAIDPPADYTVHVRVAPVGRVVELPRRPGDGAVLDILIPQWATPIERQGDALSAISLRWAWDHETFGGSISPCEPRDRAAECQARLDEQDHGRYLVTYDEERRQLRGELMEGSR